MSATKLPPPPLPKKTSLPEKKNIFLLALSQKNRSFCLREGAGAAEVCGRKRRRKEATPVWTLPSLLLLLLLLLFIGKESVVFKLGIGRERGRLVVVAHGGGGGGGGHLARC